MHIPPCAYTGTLQWEPRATSDRAKAHSSHANRKVAGHSKNTIYHPGWICLNCPVFTLPRAMQKPRPSPDAVCRSRATDKLNYVAGRRICVVFRWENSCQRARSNGNVRYGPFGHKPFCVCVSLIPSRQERASSSRRNSFRVPILHHLVML